MVSWAVELCNVYMDWVVAGAPPNPHVVALSRGFSSTVAKRGPMVRLRAGESFPCNVGHVVCSPCRDRLKATSKCHLCDVALRDDDDDCEIDDHEMNDGAAASTWYLFLLNMERKQFGRAISVLCIHPDASGSLSPSKEIKCELVYSGYVSSKDGDQVVSHYQQSEFRVACTDLSNGLPDLNERFQFIVPRFAYRDVEEDAIEVTVWLFIN
ncbi:hypothetical protein EJB05_33722 [Eragrostis curvula]|uniref:SIAH-type domain-containing protein n=1 Tax=Eragrostis curvula TaxID=38414 RepID=A0A5J9U1U1_9POAL|nr:hypothetical protein EJB05_33722 [Eragrostis curvula]